MDFEVLTIAIIICYLINLYTLYKLNKKIEEKTVERNFKYELNMLEYRINKIEKKLNNDD